MQDKIYYAIEIDDDNPFASVAEVHCYVHNCFGCLLDDTLWNLWAQLCDTSCDDEYADAIPF